MAQDFQWNLERFGGLRHGDGFTQSLSDSESPEMVNFTVTEGRELKRREGFDLVFPASEPLRGIFCGTVNGRKCFLAVMGSALLYSDTSFSHLIPLTGTVPGEEKVTFFPFYGKIYLLTGAGIVCFDGENLLPLEPHIPLLMISTAPDGSGVVYEEVNMLTRKVRQRFSPDGRSSNFWPVLRNLREVDWVRLEGRDVPYGQWIWDDALHAFSFVSAPRAGIDTLEVQYEIEAEDPSDRILNCRYATAFGGASDTRAFLYGNRDSVAVRYHSGIVEGKPEFSYFPETAFSLVGSGEPITSILRHYDRQLIFTASSAYYSYLEYLTGSEERLVASFPVLPLNEERGCVPYGQAMLVENTPVTLTEDGLLEWVSTNIRDERNAQVLSGDISYFLRRETPEDAVLFHNGENGEIYLCVNGHGYIYNYRLKLFYYYTLPLIRGFCQGDEGTFFYTDEGIFVIGGQTDHGEKICARWRSKLLDFSRRGKNKKLFGATIFAYAPEGGTLCFSLRGRGDQEICRKDVAFRGKEEGEKHRFRMFKRRFDSFSTLLSWEEEKPLRIGGIFLKGRVTDSEGS